MTTLRQAAQAALEALLAADLAMANGGILACHASRKQIAAAIEALRATLAEPQPVEWNEMDALKDEYWNEPQPEPVAEVYDTFGNSQDPTKGSGHVWLAPNYFPPRGTKLYAAPQAQQPLKERPDFIAGYTTGLADGKTCAERDSPRKPMTDDQIRELVEECGLPWRQGFVPLYPGDTTNRYAVLVREVEGMYNSEAP